MLIPPADWIIAFYEIYDLEEQVPNEVLWDYFITGLSPSQAATTEALNVLYARKV
jgi:hypothetical protein